MFLHDFFKEDDKVSKVDMSKAVIKPSIEELKKLDTELYDIAPVSTEILSDFITPVEALRIFKNVSTHTYMLESAEANETWGRYTFLGFDPKLEITCLEGELKIGDETIKTDDPSAHIRKIMKEYANKVWFNVLVVLVILVFIFIAARNMNAFIDGFKNLISG